MSSPTTYASHVAADVRECVDNCLSCAALCRETMMHCLRMCGTHAEAEHVRVLLDCAEICETAAAFMLRGSDTYPMVCEVCAQVCERCAQSCEKLADDQRMKECADLCRRCAQSCRLMTH
jgi:hypothetical protein